MLSLVTLGTCDITLITQAVKAIREAADAAAADRPDYRVCCWSTQRLAHQESVIETRVDAAGHEYTSVIAVPVAGGDATHLGLWGPNPARAVAAWLESTVELHEPKTDLAQGPEPREDLSACQWCADEDTPCADLRHARAIAELITGRMHLADTHADAFTPR